MLLVSSRMGFPGACGALRPQCWGVQGSPGWDRGMEVLGVQTTTRVPLGVLAPDPCSAAPKRSRAPV